MNFLLKKYEGHHATHKRNHKTEMKFNALIKYHTCLITLCVPYISNK